MVIRLSTIVRHLSVRDCPSGRDAPDVATRGDEVLEAVELPEADLSERDVVEAAEMQVFRHSAH